MTEHWDEHDDEEPVEATVLLPEPTQPIRVLRPLEPALIVNDEAYLHHREVDSSFSLCGARTAQPLQRGDARRSLPVCPLCAHVAGGEA